MNTNNKILLHFEGNTEDLRGIKVTIKSLREYYRDSIVVLYKNVSNNLLLFLKNHNVECVDVSDYKVTFNTSAYNNKMIYTFLYMKKHKNDLANSNILICDIGDFYFKCNPFEIQNKKLLVSLEDKLIKDCEVNLTWVNVCYNANVVESIKNNIVVNCGFILGSFEQIYSLIELLLKDMASVLAKINYPIVDQAILNKLIYFDKIECYLDSSNINNMSQGIKTTIDNKINHQYKVIDKIKNQLFANYE